MKKTNEENRRKIIELKTQKSIPIEQWEELKAKAYLDFPPHIMMDYLVKSTNGTVYVDRTKMIHNKEQEQEFCYLLKENFIAVWKDIENLTAYFEIAENEIISGTYNIITDEKISKRILISNNWETACYNYSADEIEVLKQKIYTAPNAPQRAK